MSGLIWGGIGKGIADAGQSVGGMMFKSIEGDIADQRAMQRAEALERLKEQMLEERAQKDAAKAMEVDARATQIADTRASKTLQADAGKLAANAGMIAGESPAMNEEQMKAHLQSLSPQERKALEGTGLISRSMTRNDTRLQGADDAIQAARELGASSSLLKSYQDTKRSVLDEIKEENKETERKAERDFNNRREDRRDQEARDRGVYQDRMAGAAERRAGAAETAASRPRSGGADPNKPATTADLQRQITAAQNSLATELGVGKNDVNSEVASLKKKAANGNTKAQATLDSIEPFLTELQDANRRMMDFKRARPGPSENSGDNQPSRPPLSSFRR